MKAAVLIALASGLAGCASTVTEYRSEAPALEYVTAKSPDETVRCLGGQFEALGNAATLKASSVGQTLGWTDNTRMFVDVLPTEGGTRVVFHKHGVLFGDQYTAAVSRCRD